MKGTEIIVVGAGCVGANVAYRLAERGARVTVLEASAPGGGTSRASFAWTNSFGKTPRDYHDLNVASMEEHTALAKELGGSWLHQDGALAWEESPVGRERLDQAVERLAGWGYSVERIPAQEARELEPDLHIAAHVDEVVWTPGEGYVEAVPFIGALLAQASRHGARVLSGQRVTGMIRAGDRVWGESADPWPAERSLAAVAAHLPALAGGRVEATRVGVRPMPRDERPMLGRVSGLEGFYVVVSHSGVTLGPLWGRIVAAELLEGAVDPRLGPYRPARFLTRPS